MKAIRYLAIGSRRSGVRNSRGVPLAVIENFRPGTLERWRIGLALTRVSAFGQYGPYSHAQGSGTLAEAMGGIASVSAAPDGPPVLPAYQLGDSLAGLYAGATLIELHARARMGHGQIADVRITEGVISILGAHFAATRSWASSRPVRRPRRRGTSTAAGTATGSPSRPRSPPSPSASCVSWDEATSRTSRGFSRAAEEGRTGPRSTKR